MNRWLTLAGDPKRAIRALKNRRAESAAASAATGWQQGPAGLKSRTYRSYDDYVRHQVSKLELRRHDIERFDQAVYEGVARRIDDLELAGKTVLCLAARLGGEVRAFRERSAFAVGVDLNPGKGNPWVMYGDFHDLMFPNACAEVVFTNSLDHALDVQRVATEVRRLMVSEGLFIVEASAGEGEYAPKTWEAQSWTSIDGLIEVIESCSFSLAERRPIEGGLWPGEHLRFRPHLL